MSILGAHGCFQENEDNKSLGTVHNLRQTPWSGEERPPALQHHRLEEQDLSSLGVRQPRFCGPEASGLRDVGGTATFQDLTPCLLLPGANSAPVLWLDYVTQAGEARHPGPSRASP